MDDERPGWFRTGSPKCVILCGGKGTRLLPLSLERQKSMIEVAGEPILWHVVRAWRRYTDDFIFIVKTRQKEIRDYVPSLGVRYDFVEPTDLRGIADAVSYVADRVQDRFCVVLGDCLCSGTFAFPEDMVQGVGVCEAEQEKDILNSFSVETETGEIDGDILRVVEKPKTCVNRLCGMGFYFLDRRVFGYIAKAKPSSVRNEKEITDVLQSMISGGERISSVPFRGAYVNVTTPEDLDRASRFFHLPSPGSQHD